MSQNVESREQTIAKLVSRVHDALGLRHDNDRLYTEFFREMTDKEFALTADAILRTHTLRQIHVVHTNMFPLFYDEYTDVRTRAKYVAFCYITVLWGLQFSPDGLPYELISSNIVDTAQNFFDPKRSALGTFALTTDGWADYAVGYMIESMVMQDSRCSHSSMEHLEWLTQNVRELAPHRETITARLNVSRDFCETLLSNISLAVEEGVL